MLAAVEDAVRHSGDFIADMKLDGAVAIIMSAVRSINVFLQERAPWGAAKEGRQADVEATLYVAADALQRCAALLHPIMPEKMVQLRTALGVMRCNLSLRRYDVMAS